MNNRIIKAANSNHYKRHCHLTWLLYDNIHLNNRRLNNISSDKIIKIIKKEIKKERTLARIRKWTYSKNRHIALLMALTSEIDKLKAQY